MQFVMRYRFKPLRSFRLLFQEFYFSFLLAFALTFLIIKLYGNITYIFVSDKRTNETINKEKNS